MTPRLPTVGSDQGAWGNLLNAYLNSLVNGGQVYDVATIYGGPGKADDATNIQSALTAAGATGGGRVFLQKGTWNIGTGLTVTADNVELAGVGWGTMSPRRDRQP